MTRLPARWVLASGNAGKYAEFRRLLAPAGIELASQRDFDLESPEETGHSFVENALLKARHAAAATGMPSIADDSGLAVDALGGAPGIRSARFADGSQCANNARLLHLLEDVPEPRRGARFCCVVVALRRWDEPDAADRYGGVARQDRARASRRVGLRVRSGILRSRVGRYRG